MAIRYIMRHGVADTTAWPWENHKQANSPRYFASSRENAAETKIDQSFDVLILIN